MTLRQLHGLRYQPSPSGICISLLVMGHDNNYDPDYRGTADQTMVSVAAQAEMSL